MRRKDFPLTQLLLHAVAAVLGAALLLAAPATAGELVGPALGAQHPAATS